MFSQCSLCSLGSRCLGPTLPSRGVEMPFQYEPGPTSAAGAAHGRKEIGRNVALEHVENGKADTLHF